MIQNKPIRVLHVDQETSFLKVTKSILELLGNFEIDSAQTVEQANRSLEKKKYDVIISAYFLDTTNGLNFLNQLRERKIDVPFVMFSFNDEISKDAADAGIQLIVKYGDPEKVFARLTDVISQYGK